MANRPSNKTIIKKYIEHYKHSHQSQKTRNSALNSFFNENSFHYQGHVFDIDTSILIEYFEWLKAKDLTKTTKINKWNLLNSFLGYVKEYYTAKGFSFPKMITPSKTIDWNGSHARSNSNKNVLAEPEELQSILNYLKTEKDFTYYIIFRLFTETGMRKGELVNAKLEEVNMEYRYINPFMGKTGEKYYFFTPEFKKWVQIYLNERKRRFGNEGFLFLNSRGRQFTLRDFNQYLAGIRKELGITKRITTHTFRRTINTFRKKMGTSLEDRERLLGHTTRNVNVKGYTILDIEEHQKIYDANFPYQELQF